MKKLIVILDSPSIMDYSHIHITYDDTELAIKECSDIVVTTLINFLNFKYIEKGYSLYAVRNHIIKEFVPDMIAPSGKEIRFAHNLEKLFIAGVFDNLWLNSEVE